MEWAAVGRKLTVAGLALLGPACASGQEVRQGRPVHSAATPVEFASAPSSEDAVYAIDWPTLLELARGPSSDVALAAEKVHEAEAGVNLAESAWLPNLRLGVSWLHHDGAIQDIPGNVINANKNALYAGPLVRASLDPQTVQRDVVKARGLARVRCLQLNRASRQQLHDAAQAFVDLQAAQAGIAIQREGGELLKALVDRAEKIEKVGMFSKADVNTYRNAMIRQNIEGESLQSRHRTAGINLASRLNIEPNARLYVAEQYVEVLQLVEVDQPEDVLIAQAMHSGPGIEEIDAVRCNLNELAEAARKYRLAPTFGVDVGYGAFGGGVGTRYGNWGDRLDVGVNLTWDVTDLLKSGPNRAMFGSKVRQAEIQREQLQKKLALGVRVALEQIRNTRLQLERHKEAISRAIDQYQKARDLEKALGVPLPLGGGAGGQGSDVGNVLSRFGLEARAIGDLATARVGYLETLRDHNKAQISLQYYLGASPESGQARQAPIAPPVPPQAGNGAGGAASPTKPPASSDAGSRTETRGGTTASPVARARSGGPRYPRVAPKMSPGDAGL